MNKNIEQLTQEIFLLKKIQKVIFLMQEKKEQKKAKTLLENIEKTLNYDL